MFNKDKSQYVLKWAKKLKAVEMLGGKCSQCDCKDPRILQFHHPNDDKEGKVNKLGSWQILEKEAKKCVLLCGNCHHIEHFSSTNINNDKFRNNKKIILDFVGKKECEECGWNGHQCALVFHHLNPKEKDFILSKVRTILHTVQDLQQNIIDEVNKCQLLCANCHQLKHIVEKYYIYEKEIIEKSKNVRLHNKLDHEEIQKLHKEGNSIYKIAKIFNTNKSSIHYIIHKND